jgi:F0F1-type ATP synthase membrane subunit c/vacuolar-type H+-ATPase subunit K
MKRTMNIRAASTLGAATLGMILLAGPAASSQGTGDGGTGAKVSQATRVQAELNDLRSSSVGILKPPVVRPVGAVTTPGNPIEYLQIGLGALGGIAIAGAGAAAASARRNRQPHTSPA